MARKKPAKKAKKTSAAKPAATLRQAQGGPERSRGTRKSATKSSKKAGKKAVKAAKKPARKAPKKAAPKPAARKTAAKKAAKKAVKKAAPTKKAASKPAPKKAAPRKAAPAVAAKKPNLDRPRKTVADIRGIPSSLDMNRTPSAAKSGRAELRDKLAKSTGGGAALTAGDDDADWQSAEAVGDEAPGGDNPTPDQDVVDDIGRALGVEYEDDEELQGGAEISDRDTHRWELDPSSKDDFEDNE